MDGKCQAHDQCIGRIQEGITEILVRLEQGSGNFDLLAHRIQFLERIVFAMVGTAGMTVLGAVIAVALGAVRIGG